MSALAKIEAVLVQLRAMWDVIPRPEFGDVSHDITPQQLADLLITIRSHENTVARMHERVGVLKGALLARQADFKIKSQEQVASRPDVIYKGSVKERRTYVLMEHFSDTWDGIRLTDTLVRSMQALDREVRRRLDFLKGYRYDISLLIRARTQQNVLTGHNPASTPRQINTFSF